MGAVLIEEQSDLLVFRLPNQADLFSIALLPIAVCGFLGLVCLPLYGLVSGSIFALNASTPTLSLVIFALATSTAFGAAALYWIYNIFKINFGQEVLTVNQNSLTLELRILRFSRSTTYSQREVWQLRSIEKKRFFYQRSLDLDLGSYTLAFDHNAGTVFFGASISEKAASEILEIICDKFPQYKPRGSATRHQWTPPRAS